MKRTKLFASAVAFPSLTVSPELCIKDNKGAGTKPSSAYTDIYTSGMVNWWWDSLYRTDRYVDAKAVEWNDENK